MLVGHSTGGLYVRLYASRFPTEVAGVVLVDADSAELDRRRPPRLLKLLRCEAEIRLGVRRLEHAIGPDRDVRKLPSEVRRMAAARAMRPATCRAVHDEASVRPESRWQIRAAGDLGGKPLMVVTRGRDLDAQWRISQAALLRLSTNSSQVAARESDHYIQLDQPAVVVGAIRTVVAAARRTSQCSRHRT